MSESQQLLAEYAATRSEEAFQELVTRYVDLVYATALRLVEGDAHRAQDVAQMVFVDLARMAARLSPNTMLGGWLHRHTCYVARTMRRGERRRQIRERQAAEMSALDNHPDTALAEISAVLDEAINELGADDRDAVVLRFFERRNLRSVGEVLGISENVAQKRVARALQELGGLLRRRGYSVPVAVLATCLAAEAAKAAPLGLAIGLAKTALAAAGTTAGTAGSSAQLALATKLKIALIGALLLTAIVTTLFWWNQARPIRLGSLQLPPVETAESRAVDPPDSGPSVAAASEASPVPGAPPAATNLSGQPLPLANVTSEPVSSPKNPVVATPEPPLPASIFLQRFAARTGSRLRIEGTSGTEGWQAESRIIGGYLDIESGWPPDPAHPPHSGPVQAKAEIFVQVHSLQLVDAAGRLYSDTADQIMYEQLKAGTDPNARIIFRLTGLRFVESTRTNAAVYLFQARGNLAVAGVTNPIGMLVAMVSQGGGALKFSGSFPLKMSAFHINPAASRLLPKPYDNVTVKFDWIVALRGPSPVASRDGVVPLILSLPTPGFLTPSAQDPAPGGLLEPASGLPRPPMLVPPGLTNVARASHITSSDKNAPASGLARIIDGNKQAFEQGTLFLRPGLQWVQLDLGRAQEIFAVAIWHSHSSPRVFHDVIVAIADDRDFQSNVELLFNNDGDNTSGLGTGFDREYAETYEGKLIDAKGAVGRYLRFYSNGSNQSASNEYTEIEIYGRLTR